MMGLKRTLFPAVELRPAAKSQSIPHVTGSRRHVTSSKHVLGGDSLANLGNLVSDGKTSRRSKHQRQGNSHASILATLDENVPHTKICHSMKAQIFSKTLRCTVFTMDSLASLGVATKIPIPVSPRLVVREKETGKKKTKRSKHISPPQKIRRMQISCTTRNYLTTLKDGTKALGARSNRPEHYQENNTSRKTTDTTAKVRTRRAHASLLVVSSRSTGLGAMFGIAVPLDRPKTVRIVHDQDLEVSPLSAPIPTCRLISPQHDAIATIAMTGKKICDGSPSEIERDGSVHNRLKHSRWKTSEEISSHHPEALDRDVLPHVRSQENKKNKTQSLRQAHPSRRSKRHREYDAERSKEDANSCTSHKPDPPPDPPGSLVANGSAVKCRNSMHLNATFETHLDVTKESSGDDREHQPVRRSKRRRSGMSTSSPGNDLSASAIAPTDGTPKHNNNRLSQSISNGCSNVKGKYHAGPKKCSNRRKSESSESSKCSSRTSPTKTRDDMQTGPASESSNPDHGSLLKEDTTNQVRRSRRNASRPNRLGAFVDDENCKYAFESLGMPPKENTTTIFSKTPMTTRFKGKINDKLNTPKGVCITSISSIEAEDTREWKDKELLTLRHAHRDVDPKSRSFWDDIGDQVASRSASECREKWFSLAKTPVVPSRKPKQDSLGRARSTLGGTDDDIFNATPMRSLFQLPDLGTFGFFGNLDIGSAIKVTNTSGIDEAPPPQAKQGYKTYIKNVKRDVNKSAKSRPPKPIKPLKSKRNLSLKDIEGDVNVKGRLSPGGTVRMQTEGSDDMLTYECDYMTEDEEGGS